MNPRNPPSPSTAPLFKPCSSSQPLPANSPTLQELRNKTYTLAIHILVKGEGPLTRGYPTIIKNRVKRITVGEGTVKKNRDEEPRPQREESEETRRGLKWHSLSVDPRQLSFAACHTILLCAHAHVSRDYLTDRTRIYRGGPALPARCGCCSVLAGARVRLSAAYDKINEPVPRPSDSLLPSHSPGVTSTSSPDRLPLSLSPHRQRHDDCTSR